MGAGSRKHNLVPIKSCSGIRNEMSMSKVPRFVSTVFVPASSPRRLAPISRV